MADAAYTAEDVRRALARDRRVGELDIQVRIDGGAVFLSGSVTTPERRAAVLGIVAELLPGLELQDAIEVVDGTHAPEEERLA